MFLRISHSALQIRAACDGLPEGTEALQSATAQGEAACFWMTVIVTDICTAFAKFKVHSPQVLVKVLEKYN